MYTIEFKNGDGEWKATALMSRREDALADAQHFVRALNHVPGKRVYQVRVTNSVTGEVFPIELSGART